MQYTQLYHVYVYQINSMISTISESWMTHKLSLWNHSLIFLTSSFFLWLYLASGLNFMSKSYLNTGLGQVSDVYWNPCQTSKMEERFAKIVSRFQLLTIFTKKTPSKMFDRILNTPSSFAITNLNRYPEIKSRCQFYFRAILVDLDLILNVVWAYLMSVY